jgi:hypothetical protein
VYIAHKHKQYPANIERIDHYVVVDDNIYWCYFDADLPQQKEIANLQENWYDHISIIGRTAIHCEGKPTPTLNH